ncbi:MAG: prephenate dehydratase [Gammaproteobacteria bacterium]
MTKEKELEKIRDQIDLIDSAILELVNKRSQLAKETASLKPPSDIYKPERESTLIRDIVSQNKGPLNDKHLISIFREIISSCRQIEQELKVSYLGPEGTFSEEAVRGIFGSSVEMNSTMTIEEAIKDVSEDRSDFAIVPVENSSEGPINITLDCLYESDLKICGEIEIGIKHNLLSKNLAFPKKGLEIHAHEQTLSQCKKWLDDYCPKIKRVSVSSNAQAAINASESDSIIAIAGTLAKEKYGLNILKEGIQDSETNTTRFITVSRKDVQPSGQDKTSIFVTTKNEPGALFKVLKPFDEKEINLTHITYRPLKVDNWNYFFFFDFEGHREEEKIQSLIQEISSLDVEIKLLGSYPKSI